MIADRLWQQSYITAEQSRRHFEERGRLFGEDDTTEEQGHAEWAAYLAAQAEVSR